MRQPEPGCSRHTSPISAADVTLAWMRKFGHGPLAGKPGLAAAAVARNQKSVLVAKAKAAPTPVRLTTPSGHQQRADNEGSAVLCRKFGSIAFGGMRWRGGPRS